MRIINSLKEESARLLARTKIVEMRRDHEDKIAKLKEKVKRDQEEKKKALQRAEEAKKYALFVR